MFTESSNKTIENHKDSFINSKSDDNKPNISFSDDQKDHTANLPPELLLYIFKFFSRNELQNSVKLVNKYWYEIACDPTLLKVLKLSKKAPKSAIYDYIEKRPLLTVLKASGLVLINGTIKTILKSCPFLVCLDIGFCDIFHETILSICYYGKNLKHLNLEGVLVNHEMIDILCAYLPQIDTLNLSHCTNLNDETIYLISEKLINIKAINIDGIQNITDLGIIYIANNHFKYLTSIWIDGCELTEVGLHALTICHSLLFLSISYADTLTDLVIIPIRSLCNLRALTIHKGTQFSKSAMLELFSKNDSHLTNLIKLDLNECSVIDDEVLNCILSLCGEKLEALSLQWCWNITDEGISKLVSVSVHMQRLSLIGNHVIKGTAFRLLPECWFHLKLLNLTNCNQIDDDLLKLVAQQMPSTYIFDYFGERFGDHDDNITQYDVARAMEKIPICNHL